MFLPWLISGWQGNVTGNLFPGQFLQFSVRQFQNTVGSPGLSQWPSPCLTFWSPHRGILHFLISICACMLTIPRSTTVAQILPLAPAYHLQICTGCLYPKFNSHRTKCATSSVLNLTLLPNFLSLVEGSCGQTSKVLLEVEQVRDECKLNEYSVVLCTDFRTVR